MNPEFQILTFPELDSTNNYLKLHADELPALTCVVAQSQTSGKGRQEICRERQIGGKARSFFSPKGGLYFSLLLKNLPLGVAQLLTPMAAVAVCEALEACGSARAEIKWVNDVYIGGRKVCGILTESRLDKGLLDWAVIGIGINLAPPAGGFPEDIKDRAGAVFESCTPELRGRVLNEVLVRLTVGAETAAQKSFLEDYRARSNLIGREVTVISSDNNYPAVVREIDSECRLVVEADGRTIALNSGEVSVRA